MPRLGDADLLAVAVALAIMVGWLLADTVLAFIRRHR